MDNYISLYHTEISSKAQMWDSSQAGDAYNQSNVLQRRFKSESVAHLCPAVVFVTFCLGCK